MMFYYDHSLMLLYGIILAIRSRVIEIAEYNERVSIGLAVYNIAFCVAFVLPITFAFDTNPAPTYIIRAGAAVFAINVTILLLFFPKFYAIWVQQVSSDKRQYDEACLEAAIAGRGKLMSMIMIINNTIATAVVLLIFSCFFCLNICNTHTLFYFS
jgi:hypothetical protein